MSNAKIYGEIMNTTKSCFIPQQFNKQHRIVCKHTLNTQGSHDRGMITTESYDLLCFFIVHFKFMSCVLCTQYLCFTLSVYVPGVFINWLWNETWIHCNHEFTVYLCIVHLCRILMFVTGLLCINIKQLSIQMIYPLSPNWLELSQRKWGAHGVHISRSWTHLECGMP